MWIKVHWDLSIRLAKIQEFDNILCWQGYRKRAFSYVVVEKAKWYNSPEEELAIFWKIPLYWSFDIETISFQKLSQEQTHKNIPWYVKKYPSSCSGIHYPIAHEKILHIICHQGVQIKIAMRYHYTPSRMAQIQNTDNTEC